jgi:hypothetical protein
MGYRGSYKGNWHRFGPSRVHAYVNATRRLFHVALTDSVMVLMVLGPAIPQRTDTAAAAAEPYKSF